MYVLLLCNMKCVLIIIIKLRQEISLCTLVRIVVNLVLVQCNGKQNSNEEIVATISRSCDYTF